MHLIEDFQRHNKILLNLLCANPTKWLNKQTSVGCCECVWPFCEVGAERVNTSWLCSHLIVPENTGKPLDIKLKHWPKKYDHYSLFWLTSSTNYLVHAKLIKNLQESCKLWEINFIAGCFFAIIGIITGWFCLKYWYSYVMYLLLHVTCIIVFCLLCYNHRWSILLGLTCWDWSVQNTINAFTF